MGLRIHKKIGYFIDKKTAAKLFVPPEQLEELIEDLYSNSHNEEIFTRFKNIAISQDDIFAAFLSDTEKKWQDKKFSLTDLFNQIHFGDHFKGYLLCTSEEALVNRYDDLIDYYSSPMHNTLKYLDSAIYPCNGFAYRGDVNHPVFVKFMKDESPHKTSFSSQEAMLLYQVINNQKKLDFNKAIKKEMLNSKMFTHTVNSQIFALAQSLNILKDPSISRNEFDSYCKPALLSYWS